MKAGYISALLDAFLKTVAELDEKYLARFISDPASYGPEEYDIDVRAYCVLSHAAFEYLFESWSIAYGDFVVSEWTLRRRSSTALAMLCLYHGGEHKKLYETTKDRPSFGEVVLTAVQDAKEKHQAFILDRNHGIGVRSLRKMFWPLDVELPLKNLRLSASLDRLVKARGTFAHTSERKDHLSPEDAVKIVSDCVDLAGEMEIALTYAVEGHHLTSRRRRLLNSFEIRVKQLEDSQMQAVVEKGIRVRRGKSIKPD